MSNIKLILLDVDGTTAPARADGLPTQAVKAAVQSAQRHGMAVALATGRPYLYAKPVIDALGLSGLSILNGGSELRDVESGNIVERHTMTKAQARDIIELALQLGYDIFSEDDAYAEAITSSNSVHVPLAKLFIASVDTTDVSNILTVLATVPDITAIPATSWDSSNVLDIHITHKLATKQHGAERLIQRLKLEKDEVMAVGDDYNDVPLFEISGLAIAMGNAPDEVKAIAHHVVPSIDEDGVAVAIHTYALAD